MKLTGRWSVLLLILAIAAAAGRAQTAGQIRGTVVDDNGKALAGVRVEAAAASSVRSTTTGKDGQFRFPMIPPGSYKVHFKLESYSEVEKSVVVRLDATATVDAKLFHL
jgi:carboxypeptidase family protein